MPFGEEILRANSGNDSIRKRFTGYEKDTETDLDFAEARMYQNKHGRFTAVDPLMASASPGNPQTFNRYTYVGNNPVNMVDPSGLCGTTPGSTDGTPCIWLRSNGGIYSSVSQAEYDKGKTTTFDGFTIVDNPETITIPNGVLYGEYANVERYISISANGASFGLGADGMFYGFGSDSQILDDEEINIDSNISPLPSGEDNNDSSDTFDFNPTKQLASTISGINSGRLYASGITRLAPSIIFAFNGPSPEETITIPVAAYGLYNIYSGTVAQERAITLQKESKKEKWKDAAWKNLYGPLPFGNEYDDPSEPGLKEFWIKKSSELYNKPLKAIEQIGILLP